MHWLNCVRGVSMGRKPFVAPRKPATTPEPHAESTEDDYMSGQLLEVLKQNDKKAPKKKVTKEHAPKKYSTMREEALATPLPETNIGFKLLKQMGYK